MSRQFDLFAEKHQEEDQQVQENLAISLKLETPSQRLSPAQQRFNQLLDRVERLNKQRVTLQQLSDAHRPRYLQKITPLRHRYHELQRALVLWLDERLTRKGLTTKQRSIATTILCELCCQLVAEGDSDLQIIHDKHSKETIAYKEKMAADEARQAIEELLGEPLCVDESLDSVEDVLRVGMNRLHEAQASEQKARRDRGTKKKLTATQQKIQAELDEAKSTLRFVFRQLASALHPDREHNPDEQARKTELMSEANAAYERRDLVALLKIQLHTALSNTESIAQLAEEKITSLTLLLKQQIKDIENQLNTERDKIRHEFGLKPYESVNQVNLGRSFNLNTMLAEKKINLLQRDLQYLKDENYFKHWLTTQYQLMNDQLEETIFSDWLFEDFTNR